MTAVWARLTFIALLFAAAGAAPPTSAAQPVWPVAGAESAADTISDLEDQGYDVAINWVAGDRSVPLSRCSVTAIHNPDRSADAVPLSSTTVYVDISCPSDNHDWAGWDGGFGIGFGF